LFTLAVAYFRLGPISSTSSSTTVRFLASRVSKRTLLEPSADDHPRAAGEALGHVLGGLPPDAAPEEQRFAVLPLVGLTVELPRGRRDGEVRDAAPTA